jgi:hypothetical protein
VGIERRLFQAGAAWFLAGLATGLWLLALYTGGRTSAFDAVRGLHVALLVAGWLGMTAAAGLLAFARRRRGALASERLAGASALLWNAWCAGTAVAFFRPSPPLRTALDLLLPLAVGGILPAAWGGAAGWLLGLCAGAVCALLTLHGAHAALPGLAGLEIAAAAAGAAVGRYLWRLRWSWLALAWGLGVALHAPWFLAAAAGLPLAVAAWRAAPRVPGSAFLALALSVDWLTASVPGLTPLGVAASLSSAAFAALYLGLPRLVAPRVARLHAWLHVLGFAALVAGLQLRLDAPAWAGALAVVAGAAVFMVHLASPSAPAAASPARVAAAVPRTGLD